MSELGKAAFLDRDGVINIDHGYVYRAEDFHFIDGVFDACRQLQSLDYRIIVVTNQAGIGHGYYTESDFQALNEWMLAQFSKHGVNVTGVYYCPFHPQAKLPTYRRVSPYRKPGPQMLLDAAKEHKIDLSSSFIVGDKLSDLEAGQAAGVGSAYYIGEAADLGEKYQQFAAYSSLYEIVKSNLV